MTAALVAIANKTGAVHNFSASATVSGNTMLTLTVLAAPFFPDGEKVVSISCVFISSPHVSVFQEHPRRTGALTIICQQKHDTHFLRGELCYFNMAAMQSNSAMQVLCQCD